MNRSITSKAETLFYISSDKIKIQLIVTQSSECFIKLTASLHRLNSTGGAAEEAVHQSSRFYRDLWPPAESCKKRKQSVVEWLDSKLQSQCCTFDFD